MRADEVSEVLDALDAAAVRWWVVGGWGVDALVGQETRAHRDLDLLVDAEGYDACLAALAGLGYVVETDWLPVRIEVAAPGERWVDVHPVVFDADAHGLQGDPDGVHYRYEPAVFTGSGTIGGRPVACVTAACQRTAHEGYELRLQDLHDLALLDALE